MNSLIFAFYLMCRVAKCIPTAFDSILGITYEGSSSKSGIVEHFHNIYYADTTAGVNRFAAPKPRPRPAAGAVIDGTSRGPACPQLEIDIPPFFNKPSSISEDCLSVFIARPAGFNVSPRDGSPVLAWLHGGGAMYGSGADPHTDPDKLIELSLELSQPVIYVGINYRLGIFGFAASDTLYAQKSQNVAMRDQRLAFEWLQENIEIFGGDPKRVTAYGLSAGGTFTSLHHVAFAGEKGVPFAQAYMMSGPTGTARNQTTDGVKTNTAVVAERLGCPLSGQEMLNCLRKVEMGKLVDVSYAYAREHHPPYGLHTYILVVDDDLLPDRASKLLHEGKFVKGVPTIMAWTEDDGAMNAGPAASIVSEESLLQELRPWTSPVMSESQIATSLELYPVSDFETSAQIFNENKNPETVEISPHWYRASAFIKDLLFTCSSIDFTYQMYKQTRASGLEPGFNNFRLYQLNQSVLTPLFNSVGVDYIGAAHGSDTNYIFDAVYPEGELTADDVELSRQFASSVINFANTGDPVSSTDSGGFKTWPVAYSDLTTDGDAQGLMPSDLNLLVIGGPYGTSPVHVSKADEALSQDKREAPAVYDRVREGLGNPQQYIMDSIGQMENSKSELARQVVERQRLFRRCEFINSIAETMGV